MEPRTSEPTTSEIYRLLQGHIKVSESNYEKVFEILEKQTEMGTENLIQAKATNGNVIRLQEDNVKNKQDIEALKASNSFNSGGIKVIGVVLSVALIAIPFIANLYIKESVRSVLAEFNIEVKQ